MAHNSILTTHNGKLVLMLILSPSSLERVKNHDPLIHEGATIALQIGKMYPTLTEDDTKSHPIGDIDIFVCFEEDENALLAKAQEMGDSRKLMQWLARGFNQTPQDDAELAILGRGRFRSAIPLVKKEGSDA